MAKAAHSCAVAAREQTKPKFRPLLAALALTRISACKSSRLVHDNALDSFDPLLLQSGRNPAPQRAAKMFHRILQSRATPQEHYPLSFFLLPVLIDGPGSRTRFMISPGSLHPHPERSAGSESLLLTVGPEEMQMEKTIRLFSSSSARERLLPAVLHPFAFLIFFFFSELKDPLSSVCPRKISERLKISPRCLTVPAPCIKMSSRNMKC